MGIRTRAVLFALALTVAGDAASAADPVSVRTDHLTVRFSENGGLLLWRACVDAAERPGRRPLCMDFINADGDAFSVVPSESTGSAGTRVRKERHGNGTRVVVESPSSGGGVAVREYLFHPRGYRSTIRIFHRGAEGGLRSPVVPLSPGMSFLPAPMPGFSSGYAAIRTVLIANGDERRLDNDGVWPVRVSDTDWAGIRSRFWAMLATPLPDGMISIRARNSIPARPGTATSPVPLAPESAQPSISTIPGILLQAEGPDLEFDLYTGPVEPGALAEAGDGLESLLYSQVWSWIRPLGRGLRWILDAIQSVVGNVGLSIMLLSVAVKFLMWPLTRLAERWQADVDRQHARIQPVLDEIRATYRGEERHDRTLAAYRERGINPLYATKSLFGYLIQIPVFIAAFAMLGENVGLAAEPWLWIGDLSRPDAFLPLPLAIPFFGQDLNLLPLLMTLVTVVAAAFHTDPNLTPKLLEARRRQLYFLAALFLALFYTFPAAMVLYWTTNNLLHLLTTVAGRIRTRV